jgi:hypothetical protein
MAADAPGAYRVSGRVERERKRRAKQVSAGVR